MFHKNGNGNLEQKVEHIMISKTKLVYGIVIATIMVVGFFFKIQLDVALIKQNHMAHMEATLVAIEDIKNEQTELMNSDKDIRSKINDQQEAIIRLLQMHDL